MSSVFGPFPHLPAVGALRDKDWAARVNYQVGSRFDAFVKKLKLTDLQAQEACGVQKSDHAARSYS
jgi:hypothetical protein